MPPSVHNMIILTLERRRLITRRRGWPRSIEVSVPTGQIPPLD
jgi:hypothetical protein